MKVIRVEVVTKRTVKGVTKGSILVAELESTDDIQLCLGKLYDYADMSLKNDFLKEKLAEREDFWKSIQE